LQIPILGVVGAILQSLVKFHSAFRATAFRNAEGIPWTWCYRGQSNLPSFWHGHSFAISILYCSSLITLPGW